MLVLVLAFLCQAAISVAALPVLHQLLLRDRESEVRALAESAYSTVAYYYGQSRRGAMTDVAARRAARDAVRAMRYDGSNYFFIWGLDGTSVAHGAHPEWEGRRFLNSAEAKKQPGVSYMVKRLIAVAQSPAREGVTTYRIPKLGTTLPLDKITYSRLFVPWGWSIGTGAYVDDINATFRAQVIWRFWLFSALLAGIALATFLLSRNLVGALKRLSARVASVADGEFDGDVPGIARRDEVGVMARALLILRDNSREAAAAHTSDLLTGLPNRRLLNDRLKQAMAASERTGDYNGLLFIDLDRFKPLNDTFGHDVGDMLLKVVAARLVANVRRGDTVARLGGDEFIVVALGLGRERDSAAAALEALGSELLAILNEPALIGIATYPTSASIGITLFSDDTIPGEALIKQADLAMYKAKQSGSNACRFFDPQMETLVRERAALEKELLVAVSQGQFALHYQAQVRSDGSVTGAEALIRWQHPAKGVVSPVAFIPFAEETGLIIPIGRWVLQSACRQLAEWANDDALEGLKLAVNVSGRQIKQADFVAQVLRTLESSGANPHRLELELTESLFVDNVEDAIEKMVALQAHGVSFSLDDFGTGYSSLSYLRRMPLNYLKIDQSFVCDLLTGSNEAAIARTIVALGKSLNLRVIAEGVETAEQHDRLESFGCDYYQGYLFGRPLPADRFEELVRSRATRGMSYAVR